MPTVVRILPAALAIALAAPVVFAQQNPYVRGPVLALRDLRGDFTAAGCALRGTGGAGTITLVGIPAGAIVKEALLYWAILDDAPSPEAAEITFANATTSRNLTGTPIGATAAPCGSSMALALAYRADVTPWVTGNGEYAVSNAHDGGVANQAPVAEGASLVVIYSHVASANRDIVVFDGAGVANASGARVTTPLGFFEATTPVTGASICFVVGDGEAATTDAALVNGFEIGENPFDGSDAPTGLEHWDTDTFEVSSLVPPGAATLAAAVRSGDDCLVGVATAFSVTSPYPAADIVTENTTPVVSRGAPLAFRLTASNSSGALVPVAATVEVYRADGAFLGALLPRTTGDLPPGATVRRTLRRTVPLASPPGLSMQPLYVVTTLTHRTTGHFIDDDHVVLYIQD